MMPRLNKNSIKRKAFAKAIVEGKTATQAYKDLVPNVTQHSAEVQGSRLLNNVEVQEEIARRLAEITPEAITIRIDDIARNAPLKETQLKALIALGNTKRASIFKDNQPVTTNNTLNLIDLDGIRKALMGNNSRAEDPSSQSIDTKALTNT